MSGIPLGELLPVWSIVPFVGILVSIALMPLLAPHFWHRHYPKISLGWAVAFAVPFIARYRGEAIHAIAHVYLADYVSFLILLGGLFTVAGGILIRGTPRTSPGVNAVLLSSGTVLASCIGTTGAAMLLIRPVLRVNSQRRHKVHVIVFFTFLVANIGGSLTPLGDPPLFLGFLHGVPFFWTLNLLGPMAFSSSCLLILFYCLDRRYFRMEARGPRAPASVPTASLAIDGAHNFVFLAGIVGAVLVSGIWDAGRVSILGVELGVQNLVRDALIVLFAAGSIVLTPPGVRRANEFTWGPIREVAYLFAGIFMTIIPALAILKAGEKGALAFLTRAAQEPWQVFWLAGGLSSVLDNAPTYLAFLNTILGRFYPGLVESAAVSRLLVEQRVFLQAVAAGAVFMGANTYIGNAPNFMVKSIAEEAGVAMPSFFGYIFRWTVPILLPVFLATGWLFFRGGS